MPRYIVHCMTFTDVVVDTDATDPGAIADAALELLDPSFDWEPDATSIEREDGSLYIPDPDTL